MRAHAGCYGLVMVALLTNAPAHAAQWCAQYRPGGTNCGFSTFAQCQASIGGIGGFCSQSGEGDTRPAERTRQRASPPPKPKSKAVTRQPERPVPAAPVTAAPAEATAAPAATAVPTPAGFAEARKLILDRQYEAGLKAMQALGAETHPDVASSIGLAHHKLGHADEAKSWYGKALAADPRHLQTLAHQGALRAEQGDLGGARLDLAKIRLFCGNTRCSEYVSLAGVIAAKTR